MTKKIDIGALYNEKLKDYKKPPEDFGWMDIDSKVSKINFLRFNPMQFNIYYALLIVGTFIISTGIGINHFILSRSERNRIPQQERYEVVPSSFQKESDKENIRQNSTPESVKRIQSPDNKATNKYEPKKGSESKISDKKEKATQNTPNLTQTKKESPLDTLQVPDNLSTQSPDFSADTLDINSSEPVIIKEPDVFIVDTVPIIRPKKGKWPKKD